MLSQIWQVFSSTLAAFFGVQKESNRQRDFGSNSPIPYIAMGIFLAAAIVIGLMLVVQQVLN